MKKSLGEFGTGVDHGKFLYGQLQAAKVAHAVFEFTYERMATELRAAKERKLDISYLDGILEVACVAASVLRRSMGYTFGIQHGLKTVVDMFESSLSRLQDMVHESEPPLSQRLEEGLLAESIYMRKVVERMAEKMDAFDSFISEYAF